MSDLLPPTREDLKALVHERLTQARGENGAKVTITWRGEQRHLDVISLPVDLLYFNPSTHRIRAQLSGDSTRAEAISSAPWATQSQAYLHELLREQPASPGQRDPEYTALLNELDDMGQREPGIVTPTGILVDGNTRAAALRDLGVQDIRVAVLPDDTSNRDINSVELSLQLRKDKRRDYSYINRLIAIDGQLQASRSEVDVAKEFNIKSATLKADRWVYALILDCIERSKTIEGAQLALSDFEQHQEKLRELYRDYAKLSVTDSEAAERLKQSRLALLLLEFPKTSLRLAEQDFYENYLEQRLPKTLKPALASPQKISIPGLSDAVLPEAASGTAAVQELTTLLLQAKSASKGEHLDPEANQLLRDAKDIFETAIRLAGRNAELLKRQTAVPDRLTDAAEYVMQCAAEFADSKAKRALDDEAFDDALIVLRESLESLARHAGRTYSSPGAGVTWLLSAVEAKA